MSQVSEETIPRAMPTHPMAVVAIGRNEGDRLKKCLLSLKVSTDRLIYVDSGSTDDSVVFTKSHGVKVVGLDMSIPFTAARARHAGFERLKELWPDTKFVHFIDGDCEIVEGWIEKALAEISADESLGIVTGWRRERHRDTSVYNMMCDVEWRQPAGEILACGGDMLVRVAAYEKAGGFNLNVIAAEDDEFCIRVGEAGYKLRRLPEEMTIHDAAMFKFNEWWRRAERAGHGFAQVGDLHKDYFVSERRRVLLWGATVPLLAIAAVLITPWLITPFLGLYGLSYLNARRGLMKNNGLNAKDAGAYAGFLTISKAPNLIGMIKYWYRKMTGSAFEIIEYK